MKDIVELANKCPPEIQANGDYLIAIPFELRSIAKNNKYFECKCDPATGEILYVPLNRGGV